MNEIRKKRDNFKWSASSLATFRNGCQRQFELNYILRQRDGDVPIPMEVGSGVHDGIEYWSLNPDLTKQQVLDWTYTNSILINRDKWLKHNPGGFYPSNTIWEQASKIIGFYVDERVKPLKPLVVDGKPMTEMFFDQTWLSVPILGKIDIVTANRSVVDYKTSKKEYDHSDVKDVLNGKGLQLTVYASAYLEKFGELPNKVGFQVIPKNEDFDIQNLGHIRTEEDVKKVRMELKRCDNFLKSDRPFVHKKGRHCNWCSYKGRC